MTELTDGEIRRALAKATPPPEDGQPEDLKPSDVVARALDPNHYAPRVTVHKED